MKPVGGDPALGEFVEVPFHVGLFFGEDRVDALADLLCQPPTRRPWRVGASQRHHTKSLALVDLDAPCLIVSSHSPFRATDLDEVFGVGQGLVSDL